MTCSPHDRASTAWNTYHFVLAGYKMRNPLRSLMQTHQRGGLVMMLPCAADTNPEVGRLR